MTHYYGQPYKPMPPKVKFKKIDPEAIIPTRGTPVAAGLDLYSLFSFSLEPGEIIAARTGLAIELPPGYEAQVRARSGLAAKHGIGVVNSPGTIDEDYRGEVKVLLINHGKYTWYASVGDRIGQLVVAPVASVEVQEVNELSDTDRGSSGFGSTGR